MTTLTYDSFLHTFSSPAVAAKPGSGNSGGLLGYDSFLHALAVAPVAAKPVPSISVTIAAWREQRRVARQDREMWAVAQQDSRSMNDLVCAQSRAD